MTPRRTSATAVLAAALAVGGCGSPADTPGEPVGKGNPLVAAVNDVPATGHAPERARGGRPDPDGAARSPRAHQTGEHSGNRTVAEHIDANPDPSSGDDTTDHLGTGAPDLPPPGERTAVGPHHSDDAAPTSRRSGPRAAAIDIIHTGLVDQGLEVLDIAADLIEQAGATATVRVAALHRLNGPPQQSVYEFDLEHDAGTWTVVAHCPIQP